MWRLVNKKVSAHWDPAKDQGLIQRLRHAINASLREYKRKQIEEMGEEV